MFLEKPFLDQKSFFLIVLDQKSLKKMFLDPKHYLDHKRSKKYIQKKMFR